MKKSFAFFGRSFLVSVFFCSLVLPAIIAHGANAGGHSQHNTQYKKSKGEYFERIATFPVFKNLDLSSGDSLDDETAAEISAASRDGKVVYYSDSPKNRIGLINIHNPFNPQAAGFVQLDGEPTSVAVRGHYLLAVINTSASFVQPSGKLSIYWIGNPLSPVWLRDLDLGGQPDSIAVSPDEHYAAIAIENERDEDFNDGLIPQLPAGHLVIVDMWGYSSNWSTREVDLRGYAAIAPNDPEPEYVAINRANIAAVTLQENNHIILVELRTGEVIGDFSAGATDLFHVDTEENDIIQPVDTILNRRREPDAITWINNWYLATANEGDYEDENGEEGGSRGYTIFDLHGNVKYESGSDFEHDVLRAGHYPESRSENKGVEPESVAAATYGRDDYLFVGSERGNVIGVYDLDKHGVPELHQLLPTTIAPEGILTIPERNLLVVSCEEDAPDDNIRSTVSIYRYGAKTPDYPQIQSDPDQLLPWSALSGMVADRWQEEKLYAVPDGYYEQSRIFEIDVEKKGPALIYNDIVLLKDGVTVNYDLEGIAQRADGSFWLVSEGNSGSRPNLLILAGADGTVLQEVDLPTAVVAKQRSNGFEGVAVVGSGAGETVYVAFQREWDDDPAGMVRIGVYQPASSEWRFFYYPLDAAPAGAWVGLSELTRIDDDNFLLIERDNQQGEAAQVKRLYRFAVTGLQPVQEGGVFPVLEKTLVRDILPDLQATNGRVLDKVEGTAISRKGKLYLVTDNDGVDDASGETRFIRLGKQF